MYEVDLVDGRPRRGGSVFWEYKVRIFKSMSVVPVGLLIVICLVPQFRQFESDLVKPSRQMSQCRPDTAI